MDPPKLLNNIVDMHLNDCVYHRTTKIRGGTRPCFLFGVLCVLENNTVAGNVVQNLAETDSLEIDTEFW